MIIHDNHLSSEWFEEDEEEDSSEDEDDDDEEEQLSDNEPPLKYSTPVESKPKTLINLPKPNPGELLNAYFTRTQIEWQSYAQEESDRTGKALRKDAFDLAKEVFMENFEHNEELRLQMEQDEVELIKAKEKNLNDKASSRYRTR